VFTFSSRARISVIKNSTVLFPRYWYRLYHLDQNLALLATEIIAHNASLCNATIYPLDPGHDEQAFRKRDPVTRVEQHETLAVYVTVTGSFSSQVVLGGTLHITLLRAPQDFYTVLFNFSLPSELQLGC
jgi:hypothetical protein